MMSNFEKYGVRVVLRSEVRFPRKKDFSPVDLWNPPPAPCFLAYFQYEGLLFAPAPDGYDYLVPTVKYDYKRKLAYAKAREGEFPEIGFCSSLNCDSYRVAVFCALKWIHPCGRYGLRAVLSRRYFYSKESMVPNEPLDFPSDTDDDSWYYLKTSSREVVPDSELFSIVHPGQELPVLKFSPNIVPVSEGYRYEDVEFNGDCKVYHYFEKYMKTCFSKELLDSRFRGISLGDLVVDPVVAVDVLKKTPRRDIDFSLMQGEALKNFVPAVFCFPKLGVTVSSGETRALFPMELKYEAVLRSFIIPPSLPYDVCWRIQDLCDDERQFVYDVSACDKSMFEYYVRFARSNGLEDLLLPLVYEKDKGVKAFRQMPSGIYGTTYFTLCFVAAILSSIQHKIKDHVITIQGDGILSDKPICLDKFLRREEDGVFNGFRLRPFGYARPENIEKIRSVGRIRGKEKFKLLYACYRLMGADMTKYNNVLSDRDHLQWGVSDVVKLCKKYQMTLDDTPLGCFFFKNHDKNIWDRTPECDSNVECRRVVGRSCQRIIESIANF